MAVREHLISGILDALTEDRWDDAISLIEAMKAIATRAGLPPTKKKRHRRNHPLSERAWEVLGYLAGKGEKGACWGDLGSRFKMSGGGVLQTLKKRGLVTMTHKGGPWHVTPKGRKEALKMARKKVR